MGKPCVLFIVVFTLFKLFALLKSINVISSTCVCIYLSLSNVNKDEMIIQ